MCCDPSVCLGLPSICQICVCMRDAITEFHSEIEGSLAFSALMLFLCSGSSLNVEYILHFGMLCLSAWRMMFVKILFAPVCISVIMGR